MKIYRLFSSYYPFRKCGVDPYSAAITAGGSLLSTAIGASESSSNVSRQLNAQSRENQLNRDWQTAEAEKNRQFQQQQVLQQNQFASSMVDKHAAYQSPVYQRQELAKAGINPQVYFGQSSSFSGSSVPSVPSAPGGSMPGSVSGLSPVGFQPASLQIGNLISGIGSSLKSVAEAKKLGIEADWLPKQLQEQVRNLKKDSDLKEIMNVGQKIHNELQNARLPYSLRMAEAELYEKLASIDFTKQQTLTSESQAALNKALEKVQDSISRLNDKEIEKLGLEMPYYVGLIRSKIADLSGSALEHEAGASLKSEQSFGQSMENDIRSLLFDDEKNARLEKLISESTISAEKKMEAYREIQYLKKVLQAKTDSKTYEVIDNTLRNLFDWLGFGAVMKLFK